MSIAPVPPLPVLKPADYGSDQDVRWCPGCGDYSILAQMKKVCAKLGMDRSKTVFISGIGCSSRFPYYMNTYGFHSIHGRAPTFTTGLKLARPDLTIWMVTGDGDGLSIGGNHLMHIIRRNVDVKILLFNNRIYGLTKGQYSPTSEQGKVTKSTPFGSQDHPFNPLALALGAEASFVARAVDTNRGHVADVLRAAAQHRGTAFVEVYQNCNVFNDGAFDALRDKESRAKNMIMLEAGRPIRFGEENERGVIQRADGSLEIVSVDDVGEDALVVHDPEHRDPSLAFALAHLAERPTGPTPVGVFRSVSRPPYAEGLHEELEAARRDAGDAELVELLGSGDTWTVPAP